MKHANLSIDLQLYMVGQQIKWWEPERFAAVILRPGAMHIIMSFLGSIGTLMKGSDLEVLIGSAFGGFTGIMNGKAWVRAMRAFRMVSTVLLQQFLKGTTRTFDEISDYLEETRKHPTGRHWVDNFIKPTLLVHQFVLRERRQLAFSTAVFGAHDTALLWRWTFSLCSIYFMALAGDAPPSAGDSQGRPSGWGPCLQTQRGLLELGIRRPVW